MSEQDRSSEEQVADNLERILRGDSPDDSMDEQEVQFLRTVREHGLWEVAEQAVEKHSHTDSLDQAWQRMRIRMQEEGLISDPVQAKDPGNIVQGHFRREAKRWLPLAASLAAVSLSLYVWLDTQYTLVPKGSELISRGVPAISPDEQPLKTYTFSRPGATAIVMLEDLSQHFSTYDITGLHALAASTVATLSYAIGLPSEPLSTAQQNALARYNITVVPEDAGSSIKISIQIEPTS